MNDNAHPEADAEIDTSLNEELADATRDELGDDQLIEFYRTMRLIRRFETTAGRSYQMKKIKGFCHLYSGQEAVAVGAMNAITDDDYIVSAYRDHGSESHYGGIVRQKRRHREGEGWLDAFVRCR